MTNTRLTKKIVDRLEPKASEYVIWCASLPGFGCRVRSTGAKSFIAQYRVGGRNSPVRKVTLGTTKKVTVEEAREAAKNVLARARLGEDVAAERSKQRQELTVAQLCDEYLENGCEHKKPSTLATDKGRINRHIKPLLGGKLISHVTLPDVRRFMFDVAKGKTAVDEKTRKHGRAIVRGGKGTATRTTRLLGGIFSYAVSQGYIETNPRRGVRLYADKSGERFLSSDELLRLGDALRQAESVGLPWRGSKAKKKQGQSGQEQQRRQCLSPYVIAAIRLILFTGCRVGEILNLQWSEIDLENGFLNLKDSKTGAKRILLSVPAVEVLQNLPRSGSFVIAGATPDKPRSDIKRPWRRIVEFAKLEDLRLHDLRHTYASVGAASGFGLPVIGKLLGHSSPTTTARYSHFADDPLHRASTAIAQSIASSMDGREDLMQSKRAS